MATEIEPNKKLTKKNTTDKPAGTSEALDIWVVVKAHTSTTRLRPVTQFPCDDQLRHKLLPGYTEPSLEIDEVKHSWVDSCHRPPCFNNRTNTAMNIQVASFMRAVMVPQNQWANVCLS